MIGLKKGKNLLVEYDADWPLLFEAEKAKLEESLEGTFQGIEHYGSTAVPGLAAKPILDILVGIFPLENWVQCRAPMERLGYDYAEDAGVAGHFIFGKGRDQSERTHLVHIVEYNGDSWKSNLMFRNVLRTDPALRMRYLDIKRHAVSVAPEGRSQYNEIKRMFIEEVKEALRRKAAVRPLSAL